MPLSNLVTALRMNRRERSSSAVVVQSAQPGPGNFKRPRPAAAELLAPDALRPRSTAKRRTAATKTTATAASSYSASSGLVAPSAMGHPAVELVPPTPTIPTSAATPRTSPSPQSSVDTETVETTRSGATQRRRPSSSETTAVTIYSMYGTGEEEEVFKPADDAPPSTALQSQPAGRASTSSSRRGAGHTPSYSSAASIQLAYLSERPASQVDDEPARGRVTPDRGRVTPDRGRLSPDAPSLATNAFTPPLPPRQLPQGAYLSPANLSHASLATSPTSVSHRSPTGSLSLSLRRAESEDPDSFHVRATYAQLDVTGVPHDGVDDGVERTRARLGVSLDDVGSSSELQQQTRGGELDEKELAVLNSLDRYGFYRIDNHDRLVRVPAAAMAKPLSTSSTSPKSALTPGQLALSALPTDDGDHETEVRRIAKWERMLRPRARDQGGNVQDWYVPARKAHKLRERVYKGVPDRWRAAAWEYLVHRYVGENQMDLVELSREYRNAIDRPSSFDIQIDLDVPRTITGHVMFRTRYGLGQRSLFHVLHSFSLLCADCGYVQGMGPIAATLLCYFEPERVYAILVQLHSRYNMHSIFLPGFPGLLEAIFVQERMTEKMMPAVWKAFKDQGISTTSYATKWYITLFSNSVPFRTQLRLWDALFLEGQDVLVVLAVGIVWGFRDQLGAPNANFETILSLLSSLFVPEKDDALLRWVGRTMADAKVRADMRSWREHWRNLVRDGKDAGVLL